MTTNHEYNVPTKGTTDWHTPLNENFRRLDNDVEVRDIEANLNQYDPTAGAKFLATDTGRRFLADGSTWTEAPIHISELLTVQQSSSDPSDPNLGELWYRVDTSELKIQTSQGAMAIDTTPADTSETPAPNPAPAGTIDDFESGNTLDAYRGDKGGLDVVRSPAVNGDGALRYTGGSGEVRAYSLPGDGLGEYFPKGAAARVYMRFDGLRQNGRVMFRVRDNGNHFWLELGSRWNVFRLVSREGGMPTVLWSQDLQYEDGVWYELTITLDDGSMGGNDDDIHAELRKAGESTTIAQKTHNTSLFAGEAGVGFGAKHGNTAGEHIYYDYFHHISQ